MKQAMRYVKCAEVKAGCGEHLFWILLDNLVLEVGMKEEVDFCNFAKRTT